MTDTVVEAPFVLPASCPESYHVESQHPTDRSHTMIHLVSSLLLALPAPTDLTGVYEVSGAPADVYIVLHERADGELLGYIAGSPTVWIESGQTYGSGALIELQGTDTDFEEPWSATLRVRLSGRHLEGVLLQEKAVIPITLERTSLRFVEESWIWYDFANATMHDVSRVLDPGNNFLGGGFNSSDSCMFMACGGVIEDWVETGTTHDITTSSTGDCGQTANLSGTFDASANQLDGTWSSVDCTGTPSSGAFIGGKWGGVYDKDVSAMLSSLGSFADDLEDESLDAADVFHSSYLSDGFTRADWEAQLTAWYASYEDLQVEISGPRQLLTVIGSDVHPYLLGEPRVAWEVGITGTHSSTGAEEVLYERSEPHFTGPGLNLIGVESGRIVFTGNGESQPLSIGLPIQLSDVSTDHYVAWPFGVHGGGHAEDGHPGIDFCYIAGAKVIAAEAGEITAITVNTGWTPTQWDITQTIRPGVQLRYGHIADPPAVNVGDVLAAGDIIGDPSDTSDGNRMIHFALSLGSASADDDTCPTPWFNAAASNDWDVIWQMAHYSEELTEPLGCNDREADPPYVATWELETPGAIAGPESILFFRPDGYAHNYVYTFLDATGAAYETGDTEWMTSPSTIGLKFVATDGSGSLSFGAGDIVGDEMQLKIDLSMPTDMSGAAVYKFQE